MKPALCLLLFAAYGMGQPSKWETLNVLAPGTEVRVQTGGKWVRGFFQQATPESIVLNGAKRQETFARDDVKRVQSRKQGHRGRNTLIGLAAGGGGGLVAGAAVDAKAHDSWFPNIGKAVLTPIGMIIGTVVGVAWPTGGWRDLYRVR